MFDMNGFKSIPLFTSLNSAYTEQNYTDHDLNLEILSCVNHSIWIATLITFTLSTSGAALNRYKLFRYSLARYRTACVHVPERHRSTCPHYKLSGPNCTGTVSSVTSPTNYSMGLGLA